MTELTIVVLLFFAPGLTLIGRGLLYVLAERWCRR